MPKNEIVKYNACFVCGPDNPIGLRVRFFTEDDDTAVAEYVPTADFEGYRGLLHGGLTAALLDEVMIKAILAKGCYVVTAEMTIRYKNPIPIGLRLMCRGVLQEERGRRIVATGTITDAAGTTYATGKGTYLEVSEAMREQLKESLSDTIG